MHARILIVVRAIAAERVPGRAEQIDAVRDSRRRIGVSIALVVVDHAAGGARDQRDAVADVVVDHVAREGERGAAHALNSDPPRPADIVRGDRDVRAAVLEIDPALLGMDDLEPVHGHPGLREHREAVGAMADERLAQARVSSTDVHVQPLPGHPDERAGGQRIRAGGHRVESRAVHEHLEGRPIDGGCEPAPVRRGGPERSAGERIGAFDDHALAERLHHEGTAGGARSGNTHLFAIRAGLDENRDARTMVRVHRGRDRAVGLRFGSRSGARARAVIPVHVVDGRCGDSRLQLRQRYARDQEGGAHGAREDVGERASGYWMKTRRPDDTPSAARIEKK